MVDHFSALELTYGFASPALTRHIRGRIAPNLDQHAGSELGRTGRLVCPRRGQACDLQVAGVGRLRITTRHGGCLHSTVASEVALRLRNEPDAAGRGVSF